MSIKRDLVEMDAEQYTPEPPRITAVEFLLAQVQELKDLINKPTHEYLDINHVW